MIGRTVYLLGCPAYGFGDNNQTTITGLFTVEEFHPYEPPNYVYSPCYSVVANDADSDVFDESNWFTVDEHVLIQQVDPSAHARSLQLERDHANWEERECANA